MRVQANFRALKFIFGLRLGEKSKEMEREKCFVPLSLVAKHNLFIYIESDSRIKVFLPIVIIYSTAIEQDFLVLPTENSDKNQNLSRNLARFFLHSSIVFMAYCATFSDYFFYPT